MSYSVEILADSISPDGVRLTTLCCTFPRFILAEVNTHRMLSRNSASSRAIPPEKQIERVLRDPFVPETFNKRVKGMGVGEELSDQEKARREWLFARSYAARAAEKLVELDVDKSRVNRLLEPFMWHTAIISATEWSNFFTLRCHPDAQPEFQKIAFMMREAMAENESRAGAVDRGQWHLPLVSGLEMPEAFEPGPGPDWDYWAHVSAGRCARVSFDTHGNYEEPEKSYERAERLKSSGHLSPFEHTATPATDRDRPRGNDGWHPSSGFIGNFRGWRQLRKAIAHEDDFGDLLAAQS